MPELPAHATFPDMRVQMVRPGYVGIQIDDTTEYVMPLSDAADLVRMIQSATATKSAMEAAARAVYGVIRDIKNPLGKTWAELTEAERRESYRLARAASEAGRDA